MEKGKSIAVDHAGNIYVAGFVTEPSQQFPVVNALQSTAGGHYDAFIQKIGSVTGNRPGPRIDQVLIDGKDIRVIGENFDSGTVILLGDVERKTKRKESDGSIFLVGKKLGKKIKPGDSVLLQARNSDRSLSPVFRLNRPAK